MIPLSHLDPSLERLAKKIEKKPKDWVLFAGKQAEAIIQNRIFNEGKTTGGQMFGRYKTKAWKKKRAAKGRQVSYKDLQMTGDFRKSIKPVTRSDNRVTIEFVGGDVLTKIADGQEKQIGRGSIFEFSKLEIKEIFARVEKEALKDIKKIIKESFK